MATEASWIQKELIGLINAAMERSQVTARELADIADIPFSALARKLVGGGDFTFQELFAIAEALRLAPSDLVPRLPNAA